MKFCLSHLFGPNSPRPLLPRYFSAPSTSRVWRSVGRVVLPKWVVALWPPNRSVRLWPAVLPECFVLLQTFFLFFNHQLLSHNRAERMAKTHWIASRESRAIESGSIGKTGLPSRLQFECIHNWPGSRCSAISRDFQRNPTKWMRACGKRPFTHLTY